MPTGKKTERDVGAKNVTWGNLFPSTRILDKQSKSSAKSEAINVFKDFWLLFLLLCLLCICSKRARISSSTAWTVFSTRKGKNKFFEIFRVHEQTKKRFAFEPGEEFIFFLFFSCFRFGGSRFSWIVQTSGHDEGTKNKGGVFQHVFERKLEAEIYFLKRDAVIDNL